MSLDPVQQHVHPREVVGRDVLLLPVDPANAVRPHAIAYVEQQRARAAGEVQHASEVVSLARLGSLAVERDDPGQDSRYPLRRVKLAGLLARSGGELADQVLVGVAQRVGAGGEVGKAIGDLADDRAELRVALRIAFAELFGSEVDFREKAGERVLERLVFDVFETFLERLKQVAVLDAGAMGDAGPQIVRGDDVMGFAAHLRLEFRHIIRVPVIPDRQGGPAAVTDCIRIGIIVPEFLPRGFLVAVRKIPEKQKGQHVVTEIVRVHRPAELVGNGPERLAKLFLFVLRHGLAGVGDKRKPCVQLLKNLVKQR